MSHIDELDEYEAELELRLKKEYAAVFGLLPAVAWAARRGEPLPRDEEP
jgi:hypothetical protein